MSKRIKFQNFLDTITSFIRTDATTARVYQFPNKDITVAGLDDIPDAPGDIGAEVAGAAAAVAGDLATHISDPSAAHAASSISFSPASGIAATDVQTAIVEAISDITSAYNAAITAAVVAALEGLKWKDAVAVATTANITLSGEQTIDGVLTSGSRVLVKDQTTASQNGIYVSAAGAWSRASDANAAAELEGATVTVQQGTTNANTAWTQTADGITLGSTSLAWAQFGASVPNATSSTAGILKLYTSSGGSTDGTMDRNSITNALNLKFTAASASESAEGTAEIATQAETNTGTDDARIVTPLKLKNRDGAVATLTDASTTDITSDKWTWATSATTRTVTFSFTGDRSEGVITLSAATLTLTFPATCKSVTEGAKFANIFTLSGISGDEYLISIKKNGSKYYVVAKNFGQ